MTAFGEGPEQVLLEKVHVSVRRSLGGLRLSGYFSEENVRLGFESQLEFRSSVVFRIVQFLRDKISRTPITRRGWLRHRNQIGFCTIHYLTESIDFRISDEHLTTFVK